MECFNVRNEQLELSWVKKANSSFMSLLHSKTETVFDSFLFDDQFPNFVCRAPIRFPDNAEKAFRDIRAARLKLFGYKWVPKGKYWTV